MSSDLESGDKGGKIQDDPLSVLQEYADVWEYNKKRSVRIFSKPVMLEAFVTAFLGDLSGVVLSDNSDHQKSYWDLMAQCYEHLPGPSHSKPWSLLQGDDLVDAFRTSISFLDFLDACFNRTGAFNFIPSALSRVSSNNSH